MRGPGRPRTFVCFRAFMTARRLPHGNRTGATRLALWSPQTAIPSPSTEPLVSRPGCFDPQPSPAALGRLLEKLRTLVGITVGTVRNVKIDQITLIGADKNGVIPMAGKVASMTEQLKASSNIDVPQILLPAGTSLPRASLAASSLQVVRRHPPPPFPDVLHHDASALGRSAAESRAASRPSRTIHRQQRKPTPADRSLAPMTSRSSQRGSAEPQKPPRATPP